MQDRMMISLFLDAIRDPDGDHIHARSAVFQDANNSACENLFTVSNRAGALHTIVNEVLEGKQGNHKCILSVTGPEAGFGLHQHSASIFLLVHGRKRWWFMPPDATPPQDLMGSLLGNDALRGWEPEHIKKGWDAEHELTICDQEPGDLMYIPGQWHHGTGGIGAEVVIGFAIQNFESNSTANVSRSKSVWAISSRHTTALEGEMPGNAQGQQADEEQQAEPTEEQKQKLNLKTEKVGREMKLSREDPLDLRGELFLANHYLKMEYDDMAVEELYGALDRIRRVRAHEIVAQSYLNELLWKIAQKLRDADAFEATLPLLKEIRDTSPANTRLHTMSGCELSTVLFLLERYEEAKHALIEIEPELRRVLGLETGRSPSRPGEEIAQELDDEEADAAFEISRRLLPELWESSSITSGSDDNEAHVALLPSPSLPSYDSGSVSFQPSLSVSGGASYKEEL